MSENTKLMLACAFICACAVAGWVSGTMVMWP